MWLEASQERLFLKLARVLTSPFLCLCRKCLNKHVMKSPSVSPQYKLHPVGENPLPTVEVTYQTEAEMSIMTNTKCNHLLYPLSKDLLHSSAHADQLLTLPFLSDKKPAGRGRIPSHFPADPGPASSVLCCDRTPLWSVSGQYPSRDTAQGMVTANPTCHFITHFLKQPAYRKRKLCAHRLGSNAFNANLIPSDSKQNRDAPLWHSFPFESQIFKLLMNS